MWKGRVCVTKNEGKRVVIIPHWCPVVGPDYWLLELCLSTFFFERVAKVVYTFYIVAPKHLCINHLKT